MRGSVSSRCQGRWLCLAVALDDACQTPEALLDVLGAHDGLESDLSAETEGEALNDGNDLAVFGHMPRTAARHTSANTGTPTRARTRERKFGVGALQRLGAVAKPGTDVLPTGMIKLDRAIGIGGWPRGRICEVFGPESVGVTTLLVHTLAAAQQRGGVVALIDVDHAFVPGYARRLGCTVEEIYIGAAG